MVLGDQLDLGRSKYVQAGAGALAVIAMGYAVHPAFLYFL